VSEASEHIQYLELLNTLDPGFHSGYAKDVIFTNGAVTEKT